EGMHLALSPALGKGWGFKEPRQPIVQSQVAREPPGVLKEWSKLHSPELHHRRSSHVANYGHADQEIGKGISCTRHRCKLTLRIDGQPRCKRRLKRQGPQGVCVSIQVPPAPVP